MNVRKLDQQDNSSTRFLYEEIFSEDSPQFVDYYYSEKTKDNEIYVIEEDGKIRAMLHLNPYTLMVNGMEKKANYIVAVATQEKYRKRGYMAELIKCALNDMYREGQSLTFLMPAAESIYVPHDFRTVYEQNQRYCTEADRSDMAATEADCEELAVLANKYLGENFQVYAKRDEAYYQRLLKEYASDGGKLVLKKEDGRITDCHVLLPDEEPHDRAKIMIRIVDVRRMLMSVRVTTLMAACFQITDPIIEENNRCVVITGTEFSGVMLMDSKMENSEGTITIAALSSLIFGAKTVDEVCEEKGVSMTERMKGEMEKIVPLSRIYLNEIV